MFKQTLFALTALLTVGAASADGFSLTSPEIKANARLAAEQVFNGFGCEGGNISPELAWQGAPKDAKSFAVTLYDPDAPTGSGWWHWVVFNLPADTAGLKKGAGVPKAGLTPVGAVQGRTDFGQPGYGGPCPPVGHGAHRYIFTVYALKIDKLPLDENSPAAMVGYYLHQNTLGKAVLMGGYSR
ncbi:MAG: YbhB/YbcL family Raf kinase inhibitor-like protein [Sulfuricellaceae bacterium]